MDCLMHDREKKMKMIDGEVHGQSHRMESIKECTQGVREVVRDG